MESESDKLCKDGTYARDPDNMMQIQMLGGFSLTWEGGELQNTHRTKKVWLLLGYLLLTRGRPSSQEDLIRLLWNEEECGRPAGALKNIIYRARSLLRDAAGEDIEYICCRDSRYFWNPDCPCLLDCEELERLSAAADTAPPEERFALLQKACALYRGEFLPKMDFSGWVLAQRKRYESVYAGCLLKMGALLRQQSRFDELVRLGERAAAEFPGNEEIHCMLIGAYQDAGCGQKALAHCQEARRLFEGTPAAERIRQFYAGTAEGSIDFDLSMLEERLRDMESEVGAYFCTFDLFRNIYRLQTRLLLRGSQRLYLALLALSGTDGPDAGRDRHSQMLEGVKETLIVGLRRGDVVSQYADNQFVLLLPLRDESEGHLVVNRLKRNYDANYPGLQMTWQVRFRQVEPIELLN